MQALGSRNSKNGTKKGSKTPKNPAKKNENRTEFCCHKRKEESPVSLCWSRDFSQQWVTLQPDNRGSHPEQTALTWTKHSWSSCLWGDCSVKCRYERSKWEITTTEAPCTISKPTMTLKSSILANGYEHIPNLE